MTAASDSYKVTLFHPSGATLTTFGVSAPSDDEAKARARAYLEERGYTIRAISFSTPPHTLVAYAYPSPKK